MADYWEIDPALYLRLRNNLKEIIEDYPYHSALVLGDKKFFERQHFYDVYDFFDCLRPHYYYLRGIKNYLIPRIKSEEQLKDVCSLPLSSNSWELLTDLFVNSSMQDSQYIKLLWKQTEIDDFKKKDFFHLNPGALDYHISKITSEEEFFSIIKSCSSRDSMNTAIETWYKKVIWPKQNIIRPKGRASIKIQELDKGWNQEIEEELRNIMDETDDEDIRLSAFVMLKETNINSILSKMNKDERLIKATG